MLQYAAKMSLVLCHLRLSWHLASLGRWRVLYHSRLFKHLASFGIWRVLYHFRLAMHLASFEPVYVIKLHLASLGSWRIFGTQVCHALGGVWHLASFGSLKSHSILGEISTWQDISIRQVKFPIWRFTHLPKVGKIAKLS